MQNTVFVSVLGVLLIFALTRYFSAKLVDGIFQNVFFAKTLFENERDYRFNLKFEEIFLFIAASVGLALSFMVSIFDLNPYLWGEPFFLILSFSLPLLIFVGQTILLGLFLLLLPSDFGISKYLETTFNLFIVLGLLSAPLALISLTDSYLIQQLGYWSSLVLLFAFLLIRWFRGARYSLKQGGGIMEILLYLCALEILPVFLVLKLIQVI
jgi:hypothetical protein